VSDGFLFGWLDSLPEPWGMVMAWVLYVVVVVSGFGVTMLLVWALS
jgi:hypothetical protein